MTSRVRPTKVLIACLIMLSLSSCTDSGVDSNKTMPIPASPGVSVEILQASINADLMPHYPPTPPSLDCGFVAVVMNLSSADTLSGLSIPYVDVFSPDSLGRINLIFIPLSRAWDGRLLPNETDTVSVGGWSNAVSRIPCDEMVHFHSKVCKADSLIKEFASQEMLCQCVWR